MAQADDNFDARRELLRILLGRVQNDRHPSATMMNLIEELMGPEERAVYARLLLEKIRGDRWPSLQMIRRVMALG
jgi:type IV secretory pathway VirD2 relaxase